MASASKKRLDRSKRSKKVKKAYKWKNKDIPKIAAKAIKMKKEAKKLGDYLLSGADYSQSDIDKWQAAGRKYKKFRESGYGIKDPVATRRKKVKTAVKSVTKGVSKATCSIRGGKWVSGKCVGSKKSKSKKGSPVKDQISKRFGI